MDGLVGGPPEEAVFEPAPGIGGHSRFQLVPALRFAQGTGRGSAFEWRQMYS
jgi:hypothetical protein